MLKEKFVKEALHLKLFQTISCHFNKRNYNLFFFKV